MSWNSWQFETAPELNICNRDNRVTIDPDTGHVTLDKTLLLADEGGAILHRRGEELNRFVWARKNLHLEQTTCENAILLFFAFQYQHNTLPLRININDHEINYSAKEIRGCYAWHTINVPVEWLHQGKNEVLFYCDSDCFNAWTLAIDNIALPQRSAKSSDSGITWRDNYMGYDGSVQGEYLVRLRLDCYPMEGVISSPVIDLANCDIAPTAAIHELNIRANVETPNTTSIALQVRFGPSRTPDTNGWSEWFDFPASEKTISSVDRFVQWRATLYSTDSVSTPVLTGVLISARPIRPLPPWASKVKIGLRVIHEKIRSTIPFTYQSFDEPKLQILREQEQLDEVVSSAEREFDKYLLLRHWVARQWPWHGDITYSPWDALVILDWTRRSRHESYDGAPVGFVAHGGCMHFSVVYIQCCLALGLQARGAALDIGPPPPDRSHFVTEVWSNEFEKWIAMDPTTDVHFEHHGIPLSGVELKDLWLEDKSMEVEQVEGPSTPHFALGATWSIDEYRDGSYRFFFLSYPETITFRSLIPFRSTMGRQLTMRMSMSGMGTWYERVNHGSRDTLLGDWISRSL